MLSYSIKCYTILFDPLLEVYHIPINSIVSNILPYSILSDQVVVVVIVVGVIVVEVVVEEVEVVVVVVVGGGGVVVGGVEIALLTCYSILY